jgi:hypothetical protein
MLAFAFLALAQAEGPAQEKGEALLPPEPVPFLRAIHGTLGMRYRYRHVDDQYDSDLYEYLNVGIGDPEKDLLSASASARFAQDLDGDRRQDGYNAFDSLDDTYHHAATTRLYTAYVDVNRPLPGVRLRGGRQVLEEFPEMLPIDGGLLRLDLFEAVDVGTFAGVQVNLFESSPEDDLAYGGWIGWRPWARGRLRVDYLHLDEENPFGTFDDDQVGFAFEQGLGPFFFLARHTILEDLPRETRAKLSGTFQEIGLLVDLQATYLYEALSELSYPIDPFTAVLFELEPYYLLAGRVSQAIGPHLAVDLSLADRSIAHEGEEGPYNHEFTRWTVAPRLDGWPWGPLSISGSFDRWDSTGDDFWTAGGDVAVRIDPAVQLGIGSAYALYVIDAFTGEEKERVRTVYASLRWKVNPQTALDARFTVEDNEFGDFRLLDVGVRHVF